MHDEMRKSFTSLVRDKRHDAEVVVHEFLILLEGIMMGRLDVEVGDHFNFLFAKSWLNYLYCN